MKITEYKGNKLGASIEAEWKLATVLVDHLESASDKALNFDGAWLPKSLIASLTRRDGIICEIEIPEWLAIREDFQFAPPQIAAAKGGEG